MQRDLCVTSAAAPYSRHSRENGTPRRYIQDNVALQAKALDSSLRCAPLRMTVKRASLGKIPELRKGLCRRKPASPLHLDARPRKHDSANVILNAVKNLKPSANRPLSLRRIPASAAMTNVAPVQRDLCVTCAAAPYSRHSRENGNPRRYIQDNVALQAKALDSSLRCAPLRMTVKRASLGKIPELCKGLCRREPTPHTPGCPPPHQVRGKLREHDSANVIPNAVRNLKPSANRPPSLRRIPASAAMANVVPVQRDLCVTSAAVPLNVILSPSATLRINYAKNPKGFIPRQRSFASKGFGFFTSLRSVQNDSKSASADIPRGVTQRSLQTETHFPAPPGCPPPHQVRGKLREHDEDARSP